MFDRVPAWFWVAVFVSIPASAQLENDNPRDINIAVNAFSTARSSLFRLKAGDEIIATVTGPDAFDVRFSVYTAASDLVTTENPDGPQKPEFEYLLKKDGDYYVVGRNVSAAEGTFSVSIRTGAKTWSPEGKPLAVVRVFYATNRAAAPRMDRAPYYLNQPSGQDTYAVGICDVRIPRNHKLGELESASMLRVDFSGNVETGIRIDSVRPEPDMAKFFAAVGERARQTADKQVLVFVHGFNVTFEDAARRLAQVSYDLAFPGAPVLFSWPSNADALKYDDDGKRADASAKILKSFLVDLSAKTGARTVHLMAHSMGNRVLTQALEKLVAEEKNPPRFRNVILLAPDISASELRRVNEKIYTASNRITLYTSTGDLALKLSEWKGNPPRAGNRIVLTANLETIDATEAKTELSSWSHSYFGDSMIVLGDLFHLLRGEPPDLRFALDRVCPEGDCNDGRMFWRFRPTAR